MCVRACAVSCRACTSARARSSLSEPSFFFVLYFFPTFLSLFFVLPPSLPPSLSLSLLPSLPHSLTRLLSLSFPLFVFIRAPAPPECRGACLRGAALATLARSARCQLVATHLPSRGCHAIGEYERTRIRSILREQAMHDEGGRLS